ncbi:hypothetical protein BROUX41_005964 [Berkeleyomyces rouxiae]|uniref:uncharacterized protein n=1 Tax=Berkeleyomyces rouxiae TaxID=2035830 RepID=UPI003B76F27C
MNVPPHHRDIRGYSVHSEADNVLLNAQLYLPRPVFFENQEEAPTVVFLHSWLLTSNMWVDIMQHLLSQGFQCLTIDRRGYGLSQWSTGQRPTIMNMNVFSQDLVSVLKRLDLHRYVIVGSGIGCNESLTAITRYPELFHDCRGLVWIAPLLPFPEQSPMSPGTPPRDVWEAMRRGISRWNPQRTQYTWNIFCEMAQQEGQIENTDEVVNCQSHLMRAIPDAISDSLPAFLDERGYNDQLMLINDDPQFRHMRIVLAHGANDRGNPESATTARIARRLQRSQRVVFQDAGPNIHRTKALEISRLIWTAMFGP